MPSSSYCCASFNYRPVKREGRIYCGGSCLKQFEIDDLAERISEDEVKARAKSMRRSGCPLCRDDDPVDIHSAHYVWSLVLVSFYHTEMRLSCLSCAKTRQFRAIISCVGLGCWGLPGIILVPMQVVRNLIGLLWPHGRKQASEDLEWMAAQQLAAEQIAEVEGEEER